MVASVHDRQVIRGGRNAAGLAGLFDTVVACEHDARFNPALDVYLLAAAELFVVPGWADQYKAWALFGWATPT